MAEPKDKQLKTAKTKFGRTGPSRFPKLFCFGVMLSFAALNWFGVLELADRQWVDTMFRIRGPEDADPNLVVIAVDDASITEVGMFPWPRGQYKLLLDKLFGAGIKAVGLDIMLFEASQSPVDDRKLIEVTRKYGNRVVHSVNNDPGVQEEYSFVYPFPGLRAATKSLGCVTQPGVERDGGVRRTPTIIGRQLDPETWPTDPEAIPSLGVKVLSIWSGKPVSEYIKYGTNIRLNWRGSVLREVSELQGGKQRIRYDDDNRIIHIPAWRALKGDFWESERKALKGGMALVASTTIGTFDHYPSPFSKTTPGVLVHANLIDNLLHDRYLREASSLWTYPLLLAIALASLIMVSLPPLRAGVAFAALALVLMGTSYLAFLNLWVFEVVGPALSLVVSFFGLIVHKTIEENRKGAEVRQMFSQYVAPEVVDILVKNPGMVSLGGEKRDMTIFFLDIAHFTTISEKMTPEALIQFLNTYLTALTDNILDNNGVVDKYIGDCIMAFWNAPLEELSHRRKACLAALACVKTIERLNKEYVDPSIPETPTVRIGLNSGFVVVGNTGSARKLAYTVLGDEVNLSSRLEGANKFFGSTLMASEDTYNGAKDAVEARLLGAVRVVGKAIPIRVYELLAVKGGLSDGWKKAMPIYHDAIAKYEAKKFEEAKAGFEEVMKIIPGDKTTKLYLSVCEDYAVIPPPEGWEPVFNLTSK